VQRQSTDLNTLVVGLVAVVDEDLQQPDLLVEQGQLVVAADQLGAQDVSLANDLVQLSLLPLDDLVAVVDDALQVLLFRTQICNDLGKYVVGFFLVSHGVCFVMISFMD
jgi:hypothetical protein